MDFLQSDIWDYFQQIFIKVRAADFGAASVYRLQMCHKISHIHQPAMASGYHHFKYIHDDDDDHNHDDIKHKLDDHDIAGATAIS